MSFGGPFSRTLLRGRRTRKLRGETGKGGEEDQMVAVVVLSGVTLLCTRERR